MLYSILYNMIRYNIIQYRKSQYEYLRNHTDTQRRKCYQFPKYPKIDLSIFFKYLKSTFQYMWKKFWLCNIYWWNDVENDLSKHFPSIIDNYKCMFSDKSKSSNILNIHGPACAINSHFSINKRLMSTIEKKKRE